MNVTNNTMENVMEMSRHNEIQLKEYKIRIYNEVVNVVFFFFWNYFCIMFNKIYNFVKRKKKFKGWTLNYNIKFLLRSAYKNT